MLSGILNRVSTPRQASPKARASVLLFGSPDPAGPRVTAVQTARAATPRGAHFAVGVNRRILREPLLCGVVFEARYCLKHIAVDTEEERQRGEGGDRESRR